MDFDEYEYLEKTIENSVRPNGKDSPGEDSGAVDDGDRRRHSRHTSERDRSKDHRLKREREEHDASYRDGASRRNFTHRRHSPSFPVRKDRHGSGGDRIDRNGQRDRPERNERSRERERNQESEKYRDRGDRGSGREKERSKEPEWVDKERGTIPGGRGRGSSGPDRRREGEPDKDREQVRNNEPKERDGDREIMRNRDGNGRRHKEKKEVAEPEADPERDQRTVFAYQICLKADERDVYEFFSSAGKVRDVRLIMDRNSRRSKGVGYVEFFDAMSVPMAIALSGQLLLGQPVMVKPSEAEKNMVQSTAAISAAGARRLYVGNLHFNITEEQLRQVFEPFGSVELVQLPLDLETGHCKGFGFVQFARLEDAKAAQTLNGQLDIAGRIIKVSAVTDQAVMQDAEANIPDFDDDDGRGLSLNARSRAILMQKLDRTDAATSIVGSFGNPVVSGSTIQPISSIFGATSAVTSLPQAVVQGMAPSGGQLVSGLSASVVTTTASPFVVPSECLLLSNMFDSEMESEPEFDVEIQEDVENECSKFGTLKHIFVDRKSRGHVYLRFENVASAVSAHCALNGRWFAGKQISATFMLAQSYEIRFPDSK